MNIEEYKEIRKLCSKFVIHADPKANYPRKILLELAEEIDADMVDDMYGSGALINDFEAEVAELLGKPAAVFMPSGTMAQQIAMRIYADSRGTKNIAYHPKSHLEIHEQKGYEFLHGLRAILMGTPERMLTLSDIQAVKDPLAAVLLELPQREIGGWLPKWEELVEISEYLREENIPLHMDGARLWECKPFYQREYAEIAALFDSVYVSIYKGLGGISGSLLAGEEDFIAQARVWLRRHGGNLKAMYPFVLSAKIGLRKYLPQMEKYHQKALQVAEMISSFPEAQISPNPPNTNMMHAYLKADQEAIDKAMRATAEEKHIMLFRMFVPSEIPTFQKTELTIHEGALQVSEDELCDAFEFFFKKLRSNS